MHRLLREVGDFPCFPCLLACAAESLNLARSALSPQSRLSRRIYITVSRLLQVLGSNCCALGDRLQVLAIGDRLQVLGSRCDRFLQLSKALPIVWQRFFLAPIGDRRPATGSRCSAPGARLQVLGSRCSAPGARLQVLGSRCERFFSI